MRLHAVERGGPEDGRPPVVLLHGLFGSGRNFGGLQASLAGTGKRVIALDLRNHGASPHDRDTAYGAMAGDVVETLAALGALPCRLVGHSMGGKVAMRLALDMPAHVERLVVADIAPVAYAHANHAIARAMLALPLTPGMTRAEASAALADTVTDPAVRAFLLLNLKLGRSEAPVWQIGLPELAAGMAAIQGWEDGGAPYPGPALFVTGGKSAYVPPSAHDAVRALFPQARFAALPEAGHWLHAEDPAGFLAAILPFLDLEAPP
ncbi:MAG: alpha/beta fold hydrolase [Proteobacteria bacterium]|nr:alpha/beta fold hydrolase [Pseudomonadota bacterium]